MYVSTLKRDQFWKIEFIKFTSDQHDRPGQLDYFLNNQSEVFGFWSENLKSSNQNFLPKKDQEALKRTFDFTWNDVSPIQSAWFPYKVQIYKVQANEVQAYEVQAYEDQTYEDQTYKDLWNLKVWIAACPRIDSKLLDQQISSSD